MTSRVQGTPFGNFNPTHKGKPHRPLPQIPKGKSVTVQTDLSKRPPCPPPRTDLDKTPPPLPARDPVDSTTLATPISSKPEQVVSNGRKWIIIGGTFLGTSLAVLALLVTGIALTALFAPTGIAVPLLIIGAVTAAAVIAVALAAIGILRYGIRLHNKEKQAVQTSVPPPSTPPSKPSGPISVIDIKTPLNEKAIQTPPKVVNITDVLQNVFNNLANRVQPSTPKEIDSDNPFEETDEERLAWIEQEIHLENLVKAERKRKAEEKKATALNDNPTSESPPTSNQENIMGSNSPASTIDQPQANLLNIVANALKSRAQYINPSDNDDDDDDFWN